MSDGIANASFYADFGALNGLNRQVKQKDPQAIREAARQFESLFTAMMLKSMRAAKLGDSLGESEESDMYQDMYDQQLAVQMSQGKGMGLADMLVRQLTRSGQIGGTGSAGSSSSANPTAGAQSPAGSSAASGAAVNGLRRGSTTVTPRSFSVGASARAQPVTRGNGHEAATPERSNSRSQGSARAISSPGAASLRERIGFVQKLTPYAERAAAALGVSSDTLIAQAALETGWGRHVVKGTGSATSNNFFGVKTGNSWRGGGAAATTTEYDKSGATRVAQTFRRYDSVQQGVNDYVTLLREHSSYRAALGSGADAGAFAGALSRGGYATDPNYVHKLVATTASVRSLRTLASSMGPAMASTGTAPAATNATQAQPDASNRAFIAAALKLLAEMPIVNGEEPA